VSEDKAVAVCKGHVEWAFDEIPMGNIRVTKVTGSDSYRCYCSRGADYFLHWKSENNEQWGVSSKGVHVLEMKSEEAARKYIAEEPALKLYHRIYPQPWREIESAGS
jgi:hypothetical protein